MKNRFIGLANTYKTALISGVIVIIGFLGLLYGYFNNHPDLPNGFLAGGLLGSLSYLFMGIVDKKDEQKQKPVLSIVVTIVRFLLIGGLIALSVYFQFKTDYKVMNVFLVIGGYFVSLITYIIIVLIEKKHV